MNKIDFSLLLFGCLNFAPIFVTARLSKKVSKKEGRSIGGRWHSSASKEVFL